MRRVIRTPNRESLDDVFPPDFSDNCGSLRDEDFILDFNGDSEIDEDNKNGILEILRMVG